ncbi:hypothetical protein FRC07_011199 [Ceratobasidium sp. 392]|nr:hypothetical protein FRC07_011199 [Ceratobasidium sp. 392]
MLSQFYSGTLGDFASFVEHMKRIAKEKNVDLLLADSGDLHDGSGLTDGYPLPGVNGHEAVKPFLKIPYDIMAIGNHELYQSDVTLDVYKNFVPKLPKDRYLSSNAFLLNPGNGIAITKPIGSRYRRFKTLRGRQVTSLGVIFNFKEHNLNTTIQSPQDMVAETWFQDLMRQSTDLFLLAGHMSVVNSQGWETVWEAVRKYHPETPIAILGGHTHLRFCRQYDKNTMAIESGRFMETIGWMSITLSDSNSSAVTFLHKYLDANRRTYTYHTNTTESTFDSKTGAKIDAFTKKLYNEWNLGKQHGCSRENYYIDRFKWGHPQNIQYFYAHKVIPEVLVRGWNRKNVPFVFIANTGMLRWDIYQGPFTWNDQLTVLPFKEGYKYIVVPWSVAQNVSDKLHEYPSDHFDSSHILAKALGPAASTEPPSAQQPFSLPGRELTPGYVTKDLCGGNGDDTEHAKIPILSTPDYYSNKPDYKLPDDHPVDVIIPAFLQPRTIVAINKLSNGRLYTLDDMHDYGTVKSKEKIPVLSNLCRYSAYTMSVPTTIKAQKAAVRKTVLNARSLLSASQIKNSSEAITKKLVESHAFQSSKSVSCFLSMAGEVDTDGIVRAVLNTGKTLYVPRMNGRVINMLRVYDSHDLDSLEAGKWGIREPSPLKAEVGRHEALQEGNLDLIVMPGVAFDSNLARLGYGRGYYDRFVNSYAEKYGESRIPKLVAIALDEQVVEPGMIPMESHDRTLHSVLTPTRTFSNPEA